jgi:hypothetical protein
MTAVLEKGKTLHRSELLQRGCFISLSNAASNSSARVVHPRHGVEIPFAGQPLRRIGRKLQ